MWDVLPPCRGKRRLQPGFCASVTSLQRDEESWLSRRSTNVWPGRLVVCGCQRNRGGGRRGRVRGAGRETHSAHFLSPLYQRLARFCSRSPKASEEKPRADKCLTVAGRPRSFSPASVPRGQQRRSSLWFTLALLRDAAGRTSTSSCSPFIRHQRGGSRDPE